MIPGGMFGEYIRKWPDDDGIESRLKKKREKKSQAFDNDRKEVVVFDTRNEVKCQRSSWPPGS